MKTLVRFILLGSILTSFYSIAEAEENMAYINTYQRGVDAVKQGDLERARACFSTALFYKPGDVDAQKGLEMTEERLLIQKPQVGGDLSNPRELFLRLSAGTAPGVEKNSDEYGEYEKDDGTPDLQLEALVVKRYGLADGSRYGWLLGGGMFFARHTGTDEVGDDYNRAAAGLIVQTGFIARFGEHLYVELVPYFGWGLTEVVIDPYVLSGVKAGAYFPAGKHELGLEAGYAYFSTNLNSGSGPRIAVVLSF